MGRDKKNGREGGRGGGEGRGKIVILSTSTSTQIPNTKQAKKNYIWKQHSKQDIRQEVEKNYKMFADPVFITPGRSTSNQIYKLYILSGHSDQQHIKFCCLHLIADADVHSDFKSIK